MNSLKFASFQPLFGMLLASSASLFVKLLCFIEPISVSSDWQSHSPTPLLFASCGWCLLFRCCCRGLCLLRRWVDHLLGCSECLHHRTWTLFAIDLDYKSCILGTPIPSFSAFYEPISVRVSFDWACWIPLIASKLLTGTNCLGHRSPTGFWLANAWLTASAVWRGWWNVGPETLCLGSFRRWMITSSPVGHLTASASRSIYSVASDSRLLLEHEDLFQLQAEACSSCYNSCNCCSTYSNHETLFIFVTKIKMKKIKKYFK